MPDPGRASGLDAGRYHEPSSRLARCGDLDALVECPLDGLTQLFGYEHAVLFLHDPAEGRRFTIVSPGYETDGIGAEIDVGDGLPGLVAQHAPPSA